MGVVRCERHTAFTLFPLVSVLGDYRLCAYFILCGHVASIISGFQDFECGRARALGVPSLAALSAVSMCAFYVRQYYAFLPALAAWTVLARTRTHPLSVLAVFAVTMVPEAFLLYVWKGLNPPAAHGYFHPAMMNVLIVGAIIRGFSIPLFIGCIRRSVRDVLPEWWGFRATALAFAGLLVLIMAQGATEWPGAGGGGGIIVKAGLRLGALGTPFILAVSYFGLVTAIVFSMRSATNALLTSAFLAPYFVSVVIYQHYLDPTLTVALFLFSDTQISRTLFNKRVLTCNCVFTALVLAIGIAYYDLSIVPR